MTALQTAVDNADAATVISLITKKSKNNPLTDLTNKGQFNGYMLVAGIDYPTAQLILPPSGPILTNNGQINRFGKYILTVATIHNDFAVTSILSTSNVTIKKSGDKALQLAAKNGFTSILDDLLLRAVDVDAVDANGDTALILATKANSLACVTSLVVAGANTDLKGADNMTALALALQLGYTSISNYLLGTTPDVNILDENNEHAGFEAVRNNDSTLLSTLLSNSLLINQQNIQGRTMLMTAAIVGAADCVDVLIAAGANLDTVDNVSRTALIYATIGNRIPVAALLLYPPGGGTAANIALTDINSKTALNYATELGRQEIGALIEDVGN